MRCKCTPNYQQLRKYWIQKNNSVTIYYNVFYFVYEYNIIKNVSQFSKISVINHKYKVDERLNLNIYKYTRGLRARVV